MLSFWSICKTDVLLVTISLSLYMPRCRSFIVNIPWGFNTAWEWLTPYLHERTKNKLNVLGEADQKKLLEFIDAENLPEWLGGTCHRCPEVRLDRG